MAIHHALRGERVWWAAPTYGLAFHPWLDFKRRFAGEWVSKTEDKHHIDLPSGGSITVKTADNPDGLRGVGVDFMVVDEAAFIAGEVWQAALRPALSDRDGAALLISTPRGRNWFFHAYGRGTDPAYPDWMAWRKATSENPRIRAEELEEARMTLPARIFSQEYAAEFLADGGAVFRGINRAAAAPLGVSPSSEGRYVMGVDFGRYEDFTAAVVIDAETRAMVALDRYNGLDWSVQRVKLKALADKWKVSVLLAEANAMGEPNIEALIREGLPVQPFQTTALSKPPLIEGLVAAIENGDLTLQPEPVLVNELESFSYRTSRTGHTVYEAPAGRHDDTVIALALAWKAALVPRIALGVAVV
jgi:hypothetical protein